MKIVIIGAGNLGLEIGEKLLANEYDVSFIVNSLKSKDQLKNKGYKLLDLSQINYCDIIIYAAPYEAFQKIMSSIDYLEQNMFIDCSNPISWSKDGLKLLDNKESLAESMLNKFPKLKVIKAFNTIAANVLNSANEQQVLDMYICGNCNESKNIFSNIFNKLFLKTIDIGGIENSKYIESMAFVWIKLAVDKYKTKKFYNKLIEIS